MTEKDDKFIMIDMNDKRSKKIAEAMGNPTCKKILDYLTDNSEKSEEDIAKALSMKINTVEYNLKKLLDSGLIEKSKNFFWSKRGKKIPLYKLAKKHIIISPKQTRPNFTILKTIIPVIIAIVFLLAILTLFPTKLDITQSQGIEMKQFASMDELRNFLEENHGEDFYWEGSSGINEATMAMDSGMTESAPKAGAATAPQNEMSRSADDYSTTNIQVEGVDEADIIKNDGKYIYIVTNNKIVIVNAYPAESMEILAEINESGVSNIFINNDKLITFSYKYEDSQKTHIKIYDVSDRSDPELSEDISIDGNYVSSRMIGNYVYLVANKYVYFNDVILPTVYANGIAETISARDIYYFPHSDTSYTFTNILAVDVNSLEHNTETYLLGSSHNLYVSEDNIYLTIQKRLSSKDYFEDAVRDVIMPIVPGSIKSEIEDILDSDEEFYNKQPQIGSIVEEYSGSLTGIDKSDFDKELMERMEDFQLELSKRLEITYVHKIEIDGLDVEYLGNGNVPGRVLNQFSMDEYKGYFRIATTTGNSWGSSQSSLNHMYVLDKDLELVGSVDDLAKGERIYSVRFMGEKAYMVTFRQVDPLFIVDLSNPKNPEVLGELKVTGYSSYLHPLDEDHIIGIGMEATEQGRTTGVKIAVFDVSDPQNPIERAKYEVEGKYSSSNALYDHKAFLYDKTRELLVLPLSYTEEWQNGDGDKKYEHWQGAFVFHLDVDYIDLRGKITHKPNSDEEGYYYGPYAVQRSLYMDDTLYTISRSIVKANDLEDLDEISSLKFLDEDYYPPIYRGEVGIAVDNSILE